MALFRGTHCPNCNGLRFIDNGDLCDNPYCSNEYDKEGVYPLKKNGKYWNYDKETWDFVEKYLKRTGDYMGQRKLIDYCDNDPDLAEYLLHKRLGESVDRVSINNRDVPLYGELSLIASESKIFKRWAKNLDEEFIVKSIVFETVDFKGEPSPETVLFIKFVANTTDKDGDFIPGITFMRGGSVAILLVLRCDDVDYTILTLQPRVPIGKFNFPEIPAGMLDGSGNFVGVAAKELEEETGIVINTDELVSLHPKGVGPMVPSAGGCDEFVKLFVLRKTVTKEELDELSGKCTGLIKEGEKITLKVIRLHDIPVHTPDAKALSALCLYMH